MTDDPTWAQAAAQMIAVVGQLSALQISLADWTEGTPTGGPNGDGTYPFTQPDGTIAYIPCPAKIQLSGGVPGYTHNQFASATIPAAVVQVQTTGWFNPGDGGGAEYYRVGSQPTHAARLQDASGAWFEMRAKTVKAEQFGAFGNGTDVSAAVQAAIDYLTQTNGGGELVFQAGTYTMTNVTIRSYINIRGAGMTATSLQTVLNPTNCIMIAAPRIQNIKISDLMFDGRSQTAADSIHLSELWLQNFLTNVEIDRVQFANGMNRWMLRADMLAGNTYSNFKVTRCRFQNSPSGGILVEAGAKGNRNIEICENWWDSVGGNLCQIQDWKASGESWGWDTNIGVKVDRNRVTNCLNTGTAGAVPFEIWGATDVSQNDNYLDSGTRGLTAGAGMTNGVIARNIIKNQSIYAMEGGIVRGLTIEDNQIIKCNCLTSIDPYAGGAIDLVIQGNTIDGNYQTSWNSNGNASVINLGAAGGSQIYGYNIIIRNNTFKALDYFAAAISGVLIAGSIVSIEDNTFIMDTTYSPLKGTNVYVYNGGAGIIHQRRNKYIRTAGIPADHFQITGVSCAAFGVPSSAAGTNEASYIAEDNEVEQYGAWDTSSGHIQFVAIGAYSATASALGGDIKIHRNTVKGQFPRAAIYLLDSSGSAVVADNDTDGVFPNTAPYALDPSMRLVKTVREFQGTAAPTTGTWRVGDICWNSAPTPTSPILWQCAVAGSPGTWIARLGAGADPRIPSGGYALLSTIASSQRLLAVGNSYSATSSMQIRAENIPQANVGAAGSPPALFTIRWAGRFNNAPRGGVIMINFGNYDGGAGNYTISSQMASDGTTSGASCATITTDLDASGRREVVISFPTNAGVNVEMDVVLQGTASASNMASYSAFLTV